MNQESIESGLVLACRTAFADAVVAFAQEMGLTQPHWLSSLRADLIEAHDELAGVRDSKGFESLSNLTATGLSLVQDEDLDYTLEVSTLLRKVQGRCDPELSDVHRRYLTLLGNDELPLKQCPVGPAALTRPLRGLIDAAEFTLEQRHKFFDRSVGPLSHALHVLYQRIGVQLQEAGIQPKGLHKRREEAEAARSSVAQAATQQTQAVRPEDMLAYLQHSRAQTLSSRKGRPSSQDEASLESIRQRVQAWLSERQSHKSSAVVSVGENALLGLLPAATEAALEVVERVFLTIDQMLDLGEAVKRLVRQLQIPFMRLALQDHDLLADLHHPARRLLERVVEIGRRLPEDEPAHPMLSNLTDVVLGLQYNQASGADAFVRALNAIELAESERMRRAEALSRSALEPARRAERRESAVVDACSHLHGLVGDDTPPAVEHFLQVWWVQVLARFYYSTGTTDTRAQECIDLARQLVAVARPQTPGSTPPIGNADFAKLVSAMKLGLKLLGLSDLATERLLKPVLASIMSLRTGSIPPARRPLPPVAPALTEVSGNPPLHLLHHPGCTELVGRPPPEASPEAGRWLALSLPDGVQMVGQVGWVSPGGRIVLLVDPDHSKAIAVSRRALVDLTLQGKCRLIDDDSVIDRVTRQLKSMDWH